MSSDRTRIARHEAGHIVSATSVGLSVGKTVINSSDPRMPGHTHIRLIPVCWLTCDRREIRRRLSDRKTAIEVWRRRAIAAFGGVTAEAALGYPDYHDTSRGDRESIEGLVRELRLEDREADNWIRSAAIECREIIDRDRSLLEALAGELETRLTMTGAEIRRFIKNQLGSDVPSIRE